MNTPFSLEGKTIVVTGASSGIGQKVAISCSQMGAKVALVGRNEVKINSIVHKDFLIFNSINRSCACPKNQFYSLQVPS